MDRFDRIFELHKLLAAARLPVPLARIRDELECSTATAKRIIRDMRLYLDAPIVYDREGGGYRYDRREGTHGYELPGLWFNASELYALLAAQQLLEDVDPGLLARDIAPLRERIQQLLAREPAGGESLAGRVRLVGSAQRRPELVTFRTVAGALARRRRLHIRYLGRARDSVTERDVSPQRLVHYRDNWYLGAWCHLRDDLRVFALERVERASALDEAARDVPEHDLDRHFASAYGIFAGAPRHTAVLRFTAERARWVAEERWHPDQQGQWLTDGRYELAVPYADPRELAMDILRHGPDVEVVAPAALRREVARRLREAAARYEGE